MPGPIRNPTEAFQQLEAIMLRQMLQSSGAFRASSTPGAQLRTDLFVETLADAVAKAGGLGIAHMLEEQLGGDASHPKRQSVAISLPSGRSGVGPRVGGIDDLDDPNSEAPLPEDPAAPSLDEYQSRQAMAPHIHLPAATYNHPLDPPSTVLPISIPRALNRYRQRVEDPGAGTPLGASGGEKKP